MDWKKYRGHFQVKFNDQLCPMEFLVFIGKNQNGTAFMQTPMFFSPLGAPASYSALEVEEKVFEGINIALNKVFPAIKPLGLDGETGKIITMQNSFKDRIISQEAFEKARIKLSEKGFQIRECSRNCVI